MSSERELEKALQGVRSEIEQVLGRRRLEELSDMDELDGRRLELERALARIRGQEYAEPATVEAPVNWGWNWHVSLSFTADARVTCEPVNPSDSADSVVFLFRNPEDCRFGGLNDEVFERHPLHGRGLDLLGLFIVRNSIWKAELEEANRAHPAFDEQYWARLSHYILRGKAGEFACIASGASWT